MISSKHGVCFLLNNDCLRQAAFVAHILIELDSRPSVNEGLKSSCLILFREQSLQGWPTQSLHATTLRI